MPSRKSQSLYLHTDHVDDPIGDDEGAVRLPAGRGCVIVFAARERPYADGPYADEFLDYQVEVRGDAVQASVRVRSMGGDDLAGFLRDLAAGFRGWAGARHWRSLEDQLSIDATHDGRGHVTLIAQLRRGPYRDDWELAIPIVVEAGAEMTALADMFEVFFRDMPV